MGHWGVASPQPGRIEGQPIIDIRLEDILERLIASERYSRQTEVHLIETLRTMQALIGKASEIELGLIRQNHLILKDVIALFAKGQAQTALIMHFELMNRVKIAEELFITRTDKIKQHLFEHLFTSTKWWLVNIVWPYMKKPLWGKNGNS